jgi:signal transduction histidine kinase
MMGIVANPVNFSVKETILDTVNFLKQFLEAKKLSIDIDVPANLQAYADENHIKLICRNIITNAIKFSYPEGCIYIKANIENNVVQIAIKDEGVGMKPETVLHLFNPLKISSNYGTLNEKGTGLGLQLCKEFLEKNNGKIEVTSELSKGSTFTFAIPSA